MGILISALIIAFFAVVLLIIGIALESKGKLFAKNKRCGQAEVVGYERADQSDWYELLVRIPDLDDEKIYNCTAGKINISQFPKGSVIDVSYAPKKIVGLNVVEVHLLDNPPADSLKIGCGVKKISIAMFVIACILAIIGTIFILIF